MKLPQLKMRSAVMENEHQNLQCRLIIQGKERRIELLYEIRVYLFTHKDGMTNTGHKKNVYEKIMGEDLIFLEKKRKGTISLKMEH